MDRQPQPIPIIKNNQEANKENVDSVSESQILKFNSVLDRVNSCEQEYGGFIVNMYYKDGGALEKEFYNLFSDINNLDKFPQYTKDASRKAIHNVLVGQDDTMFEDCVYPDLADIIQKTVSLNNKDNLINSFELIKDVSEHYWYSENTDWRIEYNGNPTHSKKLLEGLAESIGPDSNLLLSLYLKSVSKNPEFIDTNPGIYSEKIDRPNTYIVSAGKDLTLDLWGSKYGLNFKIKDQNTGYFKNPEKEDIFNNEYNADDNKFKYLKDMFCLTHISKSLKKNIEATVNTKLNNLTFKEQIWLLDFLGDKKYADIQKLNSFFSKYNDSSAMRTFLSLEHGGQAMGDKILSLGETLPKEVAEKVFAKYGEIVNEANNVANYVSENVKGGNNQDLNTTISETLLTKGKNLLSEYGDKVNDCKDEKGIKCEDVAQELEEKLELVEASMLTFGATVKELVKRGEFNIEEFKNVSLEETNADSIEDIDKKSMQAISFQNTRQYPEKLAEYWNGTFANSLENPNKNESFVLVRHKNEIASFMNVSFMRVKENEDGSYYGASFNVNPHVKGSRIGTELLKKVIDDYTKKGDFTADVWKANPMLQTYINDFGFEIVGKEENYNNTGATIIKIIKRKQKDK